MYLPRLPRYLVLQFSFKVHLCSKELGITLTRSPVIVEGNIEVILSGHFTEKFDLGHLQATLLSLDVLDRFHLKKIIDFKKNSRLDLCLMFLVDLVLCFKFEDNHYDNLSFSANSTSRCLNKMVRTKW